MPDHTPEPWRAGKTTDHEIVFRAETLHGQPYLGKMLGEEAAANARRLVACVNALKGVPTDYLEDLKPGDLHALYLALAQDQTRSDQVTHQAGIIAELLVACEAALGLIAGESQGLSKYNQWTQARVLLEQAIARATEPTPE